MRGTMSKATMSKLMLVGIVLLALGFLAQFTFQIGGLLKPDFAVYPSLASLLLKAGAGLCIASLLVQAFRRRPAQR